MKISGIKQQTMLVALIPILVMTLLFGTYSIYSRFADADSALLDRSKLVAHHLAVGNEFPLFSGNVAAIKQQVQAVLAQADVNAVVVIDAKANLLVADGKDNVLLKSLSSKVNADNPVYEDNDVLILYEPIVSTQLNLGEPESPSIAEPAYMLGSAIIAISKSHLNQLKIEMMFINLLVMTLVFLLSIAVALRSARRIANPVMSMSVILHKIGSGKLNARIPPQPAVHELNELANDINKMAEQLAQGRDMLEQRIQSATKDLREKKEEAEQANLDMVSLNEKFSFALTELETIIEANPDLLYVFNRHGQLIKWNTNLKSFFGLAHSQLLQKSVFDFFCAEDKIAVDNWMHEVLEKGSSTIEAQCTRHDGTLVPYLCNGVVLKNPHGEIIGFTGTARDITERKEAAERMRHMAHYDTLTDLPNRALFSDRMKQAIAIASRYKKHMAIMFIDLDKFKYINDTLGHKVGDLLLLEAAKRMQGCVRVSDTVARIGGDEFIVLLHDIETKEDALMVAETIRHALCQPLDLAGNTIHISSSIGISIYPEHGINEDELVNHADDAMYAAKEAGRNIVMIHSPKI